MPFEEHSKTTYDDLYNSIDHKENIEEVLESVNHGINFSHIANIKKLTATAVKRAVLPLKDGKSDPVFSFSSDCLKNRTDKFFPLLAIVLKSFHSHVSAFLLLATLIL